MKLDYTADESFTFAGIVEMKILLNPGNTAYMIINGNRAVHIQHHMGDWGEGGRKGGRKRIHSR